MRTRIIPVRVAMLILGLVLLFITPLASSDATNSTQLPFVAFERPYVPGHAPTVRDPAIHRLRQETLRQWNNGGRDTPWHPAPRVVVDKPSAQKGMKPSRLLRAVRRKAYWPLRRCYAKSLQKNQGVRVALSVKFSVSKSGRVSKVRARGIEGTQPPRELLRCVSKAMRKLRLPRPSRGSIRASVHVHLRPGDTPVPQELPDFSNVSPHVFDMTRLQAVVAKAMNRPAMACYRRGRASVPGLWGRVALLTQVDAQGRVVSVRQVESLFPSPETTQCIANALRAITFPPPRSLPAYVVIPMRLGKPKLASP